MMASPSLICFILIQSCIQRIWFLIESLCSNPPPLHWGIFHDLHYLSNLPVPFCKILKAAFHPTAITKALPHSRKRTYTKLRGLGTSISEKISPVFWRPVTLWQSHWYVKSDLGSDMCNSFSRVSWVLAELWKSIQCSSALQNYCTIVCSHLQPTLHMRQHVSVK